MVGLVVKGIPTGVSSSKRKGDCEGFISNLWLGNP